MTRIVLKLATLALLAFGAPASADVLLIEEVRQAERMELPENGVSKEDVRGRFGEPNDRHSAVGDPPITITYTGNEGFLIQVADRKVLVDSLYREGVEGYVAPSRDEVEKREGGAPPFDGVTLALATHSPRSTFWYSVRFSLGGSRRDQHDWHDRRYRRSDWWVWRGIPHDWCSDWCSD